jgi:CCR4-NOT transcription complex subunit 6
MATHERRYRGGGGAGSGDGGGAAGGGTSGGGSSVESGSGGANALSGPMGGGRDRRNMEGNSEEEDFRYLYKERASRGLNGTASSKEAGQWGGLDLSRMGLRSLSAGIGHYRHLVCLFLAYNNLSALPPALFSSLPGLAVLDLSYNNFTRLPPEIGQLINLEALSVCKNRLSELPLELGRLFQLRRLRVDGNPIVSPPTSVLAQGCKHTVHYLRDRIPPPPPPPARGWRALREGGSDGKEPSKSERVRIFNYNILAECYALPERHNYCPSWALKWSYRKSRILEELLRYEADLLFLQEVEAQQFENFLRPELERTGFHGSFKAKSRAHISGTDKTRVDGCCIFVRNNRFKVVGEHMIEYQRLALQRHERFSDDISGHERLMSKDNICQVLILEAVQTSGGKGPQRMVVANTHIHWNPELRDVKLMQTQLMLEELTTICKKYRTSAKSLPLVVCGDFNSEPTSGVYELMSKGRVPGDHPDLLVNKFRYGVYTTNGLHHDLNLRSVYSHIGEPLFTNFTGTYRGVLDYIVGGVVIRGERERASVLSVCWVGMHTVLLCMYMCMCAEWMSHVGCVYLRLLCACE